MIGIRSPEQEEIENIKKYGITVFSPSDIQLHGLRETLDAIVAKLGRNIYVSFDMDGIDPAFAPGVSVPVPMGLNPVTASIILKHVVKNGIIGMDMMEVCPELDIQDMTCHLASRLIGETIASVKLQKKTLPFGLSAIQNV